MARSAKTLTVMAVKAVKGNPAGREEHPDAAAPGLHLVVQPSGSKSWAFRYRFQGKPKKLTIGSVIIDREHPIEGEPSIGSAMTLPEARTAAHQAFQMLEEGRDPSEIKKAQVEKAVAAKQDDTGFLAEVLATKFIERYAKPKNRSWTETQRQFRKEITGYRDPETAAAYPGPWFGRDVRDLRKGDIVKLLDDIVDRGSPVTSNRVFATLSTWFTWLVGRDILKTSPMAGMKKQTVETSRDRVLSDEEIRIFWKATAAFDYPFGQMWRILLLTAQRRQEVAGLDWRELALDVDLPHWLIPKIRSKNGRENFVPLAPIACEILQGINRVGKSQHVFTTTGETSVSGFSRSKARLDKTMLAIMREEAEERGGGGDGVSLPQWGLHDLRRTAASSMARLGQPIHVVEAVLNHKGGVVSGVAAIYNRFDYSQEKADALLAWADFVLVLAGEKVSNIVPMRKVHN
ncbi:tyrosine-type recombinase/integrase [Pararhizobium sp.]|uniref:tyrosine-type recombinase/integrase n=1 Tax=Pararhizobium sp. TaxID=1977563 RepID=UPI003D0C40D0